MSTMLMTNQENLAGQEMLAGAMEAFWSRGYAATSMQEIVDRTGANRASLYAAFGDKRAIFLSALNLYEAEIRAAVMDELPEKCRPIDLVRRLLLFFVRDVREGGDNRGCMVTNAALEVAPHDEEVRRIVAGVQTRVEEFFVEQIEQSKADGETPATVDAKAEARGLLATLIGIAVLARTRPDRKLLMSIADQAVDRLRREDR